MLGVQRPDARIHHDNSIHTPLFEGLHHLRFPNGFRITTGQEYGVSLVDRHVLDTRDHLGDKRIHYGRDHHSDGPGLAGSQALATALTR